MAITALPSVPTRSDPANFADRADAFLSALPTFATEANALQSDVNAKQAAAAASAANALASELAANASSAASIWVSGTTYAIGNVRYSPITFLSYRRKTAGAGTTDPSADSTNWQLLNGTGNVDLNSTQTLTNKEIGTGSTVNGVPVSNIVNVTNDQTIGGIKTFTSKILLADDGFSFASDVLNNTGLYWITQGQIGVLIDGTYIGKFDINGWSGLVSADSVGQAIASQVTGGIGTYMMLFSTGSVTYGSLYSGGSLRAQGVYRAADSVTLTPNNTGAVQTGTWKALASNTSSGYGTLTLFVRIA